MWANLGIKQKVLVLLTLLTIIPLVVINLIWLRSTQVKLKNDAASNQSLLVTDLAGRVNEYLTNKINSLSSRAQIQDIVNFNLDSARQILSQYNHFDRSIVKIALVDDKGDEKLVFRHGELRTDLNNVKTSEAFKAIYYKISKPLLSEVFFEGSKPYITIALPLLSTSQLEQQDLTEADHAELSSPETHSQPYAKGVLYADLSLENLSQTVLGVDFGDEGYAYMIDDKGNLIAHRNQDLVLQHPNLVATTEVSKALKKIAEIKSTESPVSSDTASPFKPEPAVTVSEAKVEVLSSFYPIARTKWALIAEEPIASVYSNVNQANKQALMILLAVVVLAVALVFLTTRYLVTPIRQLTSGALRIGQGDFSHKLNVKGRDELQLLAQTFNKMAENLQSLFLRFRQQNVVLAAERAQLQAVLNTITDGVLVLDKHFRMALANHTAMALVGQPVLTSIRGQNWLEVFKLEYKDRPFSNGLLGERSYYKDASLKVGDKQKYIDLAVAHLHNDPNGMAYVLTIHDTTESRELENMRLDFVSMAAHELRTPITSVSGYLNLIGTADEEKNRYYIERIKHNVAHLNSLINNMLSLSKIERKALRFNVKLLKWPDIVRDEVNNQRWAASTRHLELIYQPPEQPLFVLGDELSLKEVLGNLLDNAIHYTNPGGKVTITVEPTDDGVRTTVNDTGIGISKAAQEKLFTRYYRVSGGLTTNSQGTGIGLFIAKTIVEAHNGAIGVESEVDHGSSFYFILPTVDKDYPRPVTPSHANVIPTSKHDENKNPNS